MSTKRGNKKRGLMTSLVIRLGLALGSKGDAFVA